MDEKRVDEGLGPGAVTQGPVAAEVPQEAKRGILPPDGMVVDAPALRNGLHEDEVLRREINASRAVNGLPPLITLPAPGSVGVKGPNAPKPTAPKGVWTPRNTRGAGSDGMPNVTVPVGNIRAKLNKFDVERVAKGVARMLKAQAKKDLELQTKAEEQLAGSRPPDPLAMGMPVKKAKRPAKRWVPKTPESIERYAATLKHSREVARKRKLEKLKKLRNLPSEATPREVAEFVFNNLRETADKVRWQDAPSRGALKFLEWIREKHEERAQWFYSTVWAKLIPVKASGDGAPEGGYRDDGRLLGMIDERLNEHPVRMEGRNGN